MADKTKKSKRIVKHKAASPKRVTKKTAAKKKSKMLRRLPRKPLKAQANRLDRVPFAAPVAPALSSAEHVPVLKPKLKKSVNVEDSSLPDLSEKTRLRLMARDPHWVHAYWKVAPGTLEEAKKNLGKNFDNARYVLRVHDITCVDFNGRNANRSFDIEVAPHAQNWYVDSWQDNVSFCAQLGLSTPKGEFYPLAESNFVHTPRMSFSDRGELMWMEVKPGAKTLPFVMGAKAASGSRSSKHRRYLTEDDIRAYYSRLFPLLRRVLKKRLKRFGKKMGRDDMDGLEAEDDLLFDLHRNKWSRRIRLGASEEMVESGEDTARVSIGASETLSSMAGASEHVLKQRKFFFELGTELIVYGRTEPDAQVWHGHQKIPLRPDGTFSLRFALPDDGFIPLDFKAVSRDQIETRAILTSGKRSRTKYQTHMD